MADMTVEQAFLAIELALIDLPLAATKEADEALATLRAEIDGLRRENEVRREIMMRVAKDPAGAVILAGIAADEAKQLGDMIDAAMQENSHEG